MATDPDAILTELCHTLGRLIDLGAPDIVVDRGAAHTTVKIGEVWLTLTLTASTEDPRG